ncbi:hypothetical protein ABPG74_003779 [Tetrahymena malaccensis]
MITCFIIEFLFYIAKNKYSKYLWNYPLRFFITIYNYGLCQVIIGLSLHLLQIKSKADELTSVYYINTALTIIIGIMSEVHDFSYSLIGNSKLLKIPSFTNIIRFILLIIYIFLSHFCRYKNLVVFSLFYSILQIIVAFKYDLYISRTINQISFAMCFFKFSSSALVFAQIFFISGLDLTLLAIIVVPISIKLAYKIKNSQYQKNFDDFFQMNYISNCSFSQLINTIRSIIKELNNFQSHYLLNAQGVLYENLITLHRQNCTIDSQTCFCRVQKNNKTNDLLYVEEVSELHERREQVQNIVFALIRQYLLQQEKKLSISQMISLYFYLIHFVFEILNDPIKINIEINKLHSIYYSKMSWLQKFYFFKIKEEIHRKLDENNQGQQSLNGNMIGVILFDEQMASLKLKLKNQLLATGIFYDYLQSDYINLNQIQMQSNGLHTNLLELEQIIINQFQINPQNIDLQYLTSVFVQVLDIQNRKVSDFIKQALSSTKQKTTINKKIKFFGFQKDFFDEDSCMVYCSLIGSSYKIDKVSAKFKKIFKYNKDQVVGKPLSIILPRIIKDKHSEIIDFCIKYNPSKLQQQRERFSFGVDEKGFVFPLTIKLKFDNLDNDFGACALVSKIKQQKQYILFTDDGTITDFSQKIYMDLFQNNQKNKQNQEIKIDEIIPQISSIIQGGLYQTQFCCPLIFQKQINQNFEQSTINNALINTNIQRQYSFKDSVFIIYFIVGQIKTELKTNINFVEIYQYEKEEDEKRKIQIINDLNRIKIIEKKQLENTFQNFDNTDLKKNADQDSYLEDGQVQNTFLQNNFQRRDKKGTVKFSLIQLHKQDSFTIDLSSTKHAQESVRFLDQNSSRSDIQENFQSAFASLSDRNLCTLNNFESPKKLNIQHIQLQKNNNSQMNSEQFENTHFPDKNDTIQKQIQRKADLPQISTFFNYFEDNTSFMNSNNNYLGNHSSKKQIINIKEESEDENLKEDQINEIASVNSSKYSSDELVKRQIIKRITNNKINGGQRIMIFLGIFSFLILCFITMLMHQINIKSLENYQSSFSQIDEAQNLYADVLQILSLSNYRSVLSTKQYHFGSKAEIKKEKNNIKQYEFNNVREDFRENFKSLVLRVNQNGIHHKLYDDKFNVTKYTVDFPDEDLNSEVMIQNLQYTISEYFYAIVQYIIKFTPTEDNFIWENLNLFREKMQNLQNTIQDVIQMQFDNMENIQKLILIIFFVTNFILGLIIIILSLVIQKSKENILKIAGSFQPKCLEKQIQIIELSLLKLEAIQNSSDQDDLNNSKAVQGLLKNQHKKIYLRNIIEQIEELNEVQEQLTNKPQQNNIQQSYQNKFIIRLPNKRNRSIASFNSLQKINWIIVLSSFLAFIILLIQPAINIIISQPYLKEANTMVKERIFLIDINGQMVENLSAHYSNIYMFTVDDKDPSESYYFEYLVNITNQNQQKVQKLSEFQNSIDIKRYNQYRFDQVYRNIMNGNICQVRQMYPNFFNSNITHESCNTLFNGILQRGLIISFKTVFETLKMLVDIYQTDEDDFDDAFENFLEKYSLIQLNTFCKILGEIVNAVRLFQDTQSQNFHQHIETQFSILYYYQLITILLIFGVGWSKLFKYLDNQLSQVKNIFTLFHINLLYENQFFLKYVQKRSTNIFQK